MGCACLKKRESEDGETVCVKSKPEARNALGRPRLRSWGRMLGDMRELEVDQKLVEEACSWAIYDPGSQMK